MNREDVLRHAREQGLPETATEGVFIVNADDLGRMLSVEREACAKLCDIVRESIWEFHDNAIKASARIVCTNIAEAIRARGQV
jgi:hypothetical protein